MSVVDKSIDKTDVVIDRRGSWFEGTVNQNVDGQSVTQISLVYTDGSRLAPMQARVYLGIPDKLDQLRHIEVSITTDFSRYAKLLVADNLGVTADVPFTPEIRELIKQSIIPRPA